MSILIAKSIAIHFIIECELTSLNSSSAQCKQFVELIDSYVVLPSQTQVCNIASEAIEKLNLAKDSSLRECRSCACYILMRHWKPLNVEYICDVTNTTLSELVGDFPNFVTLKVRFFRKSLPFCDSKDQVLMLLSQAESIVRNGNLVNYDQKSVRDGCETSNISMPNETIISCQDAINLSLREYCASTVNDSHHVIPTQSPSIDQISNDNSPRNSHPLQFTSSSRMESIVENLYNQRQWNRRTQELKHEINAMPVHSNLKKSTRERVTFDQSTELPILLRMFEKTRHPSREQIEQLLCELSPYRKGKKPLEFFNIQYWFKNARAMCKRSSLASPLNLMDNNHTDKLNDCNEFLHDGVDSLTACNLSCVDEIRNNPSPENINYDEISKIEPRDLDSISTAEEHNEMFNDDDMTVCKYEPMSYEGDDKMFMDIEGTEYGNIEHTNGKFRRNRVFIDPSTEIPILERWFSIETHPTSALINTICDEINNGTYRQQYQKLRPRNVQLWFKNHRAKLKRVGGVTSKTNDESILTMSPISAVTSNSGESGLLKNCFILENNDCPQIKSLNSEDTL